MKIHIRPEAEADIEEAAFWYEKQAESLGEDFLEEILAICAMISSNPNIYQPVYKNVRRAVIHRFPFGIFYYIEEDIIVVFAVMHASRHPKNWQERTE